jgi:hypothetical protein
MPTFCLHWLAYGGTWWPYLGPLDANALAVSEEILTAKANR